MDQYYEILRSWQTFYFTIGGASATLVGLMIVALSLGIKFMERSNTEDVNNFATPSIVYFVTTLLIAGTMLVPNMPPLALAVLLFAGGGFGLLRLLWYVRGVLHYVRQYHDFKVWDWIFEVIFPPIGYLLILVAAVGFAISQWTLGLMSLWLATLIIIVCGIANTWSIVMTVVDLRPDSDSANDA
jgi:hypothetical protein